MPSILVSGSSGFIGKHLISRLSAKKKYKIIKMNKNLGNITLKNTWKKLPPAKILVHLAAKIFVPDSWNNPKEFFETNVLGTLMALEYCRLHKARLIFLSSYLYGNPDKLPTNEKAKIKAENPYALSKKVAENICEFYSKQYGLKIIILRPSNAYGPGQKENFLIPEIINKLKRKKVNINNINIKRDFIHVYDLIEAITKSFFVKKKFEIINIGSGKSYRVGKIINILQKIKRTNFVIKNKGIHRPNEILTTRLDIKKARKILNWKPKWSLEKGLSDIISQK